MATNNSKRFFERGAAMAAVLWLAAVAGNAATAAETFTVRLTMVPIDPLTRAQVQGSGSATAVLDGNDLSVTGSFSGLTSAATIARLHEGAATGVRGRDVAEFAVPAAASGSFTLQTRLTPALQQSLRQGRLYIQIHSESAPDGNLWGWLLQ